MSEENGLDPNTFPIFGLFSFVLFMTPVFKWIYVNLMREYAPSFTLQPQQHPQNKTRSQHFSATAQMHHRLIIWKFLPDPLHFNSPAHRYERFLNAANLAEDDEEEALDPGGT